MAHSPMSAGSAQGGLWEEWEQVEAADIVIEADAPDLLPTYTYRVPERLIDAAVPGVCVHVPFGGQEKLGYILSRRAIPSSDPLSGRLRDILAIVEDAPTLAPEHLRLAEWLSDRWVCDLVHAVRCFAPALLGAKVITEVRTSNSRIDAASAGNSVPQAQILYTLLAFGRVADREALRFHTQAPAFTGAYAALLRKGLILERRYVSRAKTVARRVRVISLASDSGQGRISPAGARILAVLSSLGPEAQTIASEVLEVAEASDGALKTLVAQGRVAQTLIMQDRLPATGAGARTHAPTLTADQARAAAWASSAMGSGGAALLFGVTASGKTEVYLEAIRAALEADRGALVLVPEIALTSQVVEIFAGRFGREVAVLHSRLSDGERHDEWRRLQEGRARIAVGARSAIFAPIANPGLIIMDEEHESSYKQDKSPRYHARDVSAEIAHRTGAVLMLGSATPSVETYHAALAGKLELLAMPTRIDDRPLPGVHVVDMREEMKTRKALFSIALEERIAAQIAAGKQVILFLNRRGWAQFVLCRDCGYVAKCPHCAVSLAFHSARAQLACHHCGYSHAAPTLCPDCGGTRIRGFGLGTERVEDTVRTLFPSARVLRLDKDTTKKKGSHHDILSHFRRREADVLIGTQMVAKGLDFPEVTLVGVVSADTGIHIPDFRAAERTFQLLTQVAGRAGRGESAGEVVIQTFSPDHYAVQAAVHHDYEGFYAKEIEFRRELAYPPFRRFAHLVCSSDTAAIAQESAEALAKALTRAKPKEAEVIGPGPAPLARLKGSFRFHVALRAPLEADLSGMVRIALAAVPAAVRRITSVDIDPQSMV